MSMKNENWRIWDRAEGYGELFFKRATGQLEEMESSKALCKVISGFYEKGMKLADIGCGVGHYLRSLRKRLDRNIDYTGIDATDNYIALARKAFPRNARFLSGDILDLPLENDSFDIVMSNNVILHLPPPPRKAIGELIRISRKYVVIRTLFGVRNYIIKEIGDKSDAGDYEQDEPVAITDEETLENYNYCNIYTEDYLRSVVRFLDSSADIEIIHDDMWKPFDNTELTAETGTRVVGDFQVSGNLLLDWRFLVIRI